MEQQIHKGEYPEDIAEEQCPGVGENVESPPVARIQKTLSFQIPGFRVPSLPTYYHQ